MEEQVRVEPPRPQALLASASGPHPKARYAEPIPIPATSREALLAALRRFEAELRATAAWAGWETRGQHGYAIRHEGRLYPVKEIIRRATSGFTAFTGGPPANGYVQRYGLEVIPLARDRSPMNHRASLPTPARQGPVRMPTEDRPHARDLDKVIVHELVAALRDASRTQAPGEFPVDAEAAGQPGLYSWWADEQGREQLAQALGARLPSLIYAGLAGATKWPSGREGTSTLYSRIRTMHLSANLNFSTLRMTLAALLREQLGLRGGRQGRLDGSSEARLTEWMHRHLRVAAVPYPDRRTLGAVEDAVLGELDPPLNLEGMPRTPARARVRALRSALVRELAQGPLGAPTASA